MARGAQPGERRGGRQKGVPNKRTAALDAKVAEQAARIAEIIPGAFEGDAHAFLMTVYKDPSHSIDIRLDAAKAAAPFEKPKLSSVDAKHSGKIETGGIDAPPRSESYEEWHARRNRELAAMGSATGSTTRSN